MKRTATKLEAATSKREVPKRALAFFNALDLDAIEPALKEAQAVAEGGVRDEVYRVFHQSWKMYYLGSVATEFVQLMLIPLGVKRRATPEALLTSLRRWHLDVLFVEIFERTASTVWSEARNAPNSWREDAIRLTSGFMVVQEVALASLESMDRMRRQEGFLFEEDAFDPTDAIFLEVWTGVGLGLRYVRPEGLEERARAILEAKRQCQPCTKRATTASRPTQKRGW
jgi:hypothetical protein